MRRRSLRLESMEARRVLATFLVPGDYATIQAALDAAAAAPGEDVVEVSVGTYDENPVIDDAAGVTLRGAASNSAGVVIHGGGRDDVLTVRLNAAVSLENLWITGGGNSQDQNDPAAGRGMNVSGAGQLSLRAVNVVENLTGGLVAENASRAGTVQVDGGNFSDNRNGIFVRGFNSVEISGVEVHRSRLNGLYVDNSGDVSVNASRFVGSTDNGIDLRGVGHATLSNVTVDANGQNVVSGIFLEGAASVAIDNSAFTASAGPGLVIRNVAGETRLVDVLSENNRGRAIFLDNVGTRGPVTISGGAYNGNDGGGLHFRDAGPIAIDGAQFSSNGPYGNSSGGGVKIEGSAAAPITISNVVVKDNVAAYHGGGVYIDVPGDSANRTIIRDSTITGNEAGWSQTASSGGGVFFADAAGYAAIDRTVIAGNRSLNQNGGGVKTVGRLALFDSTISGNSAAISGGGIEVTGGPLEVYRSTVSGNSALQGGGIAAYGATTIHNSTLSGNTASNGGGGLAFEARSSSLALTHSTIAANIAPQGGGMSVISSDARVGHTLIAGNTANQYTGEVQGFITTTGYNLVGEVTPNAGFFHPTDRAGPVGQPIDARIGPLADNGGLTQTHALLAGSPAVDAGNPQSTLAVDQRRQARPFDGDGDSVARIDIGAFEAQTVLHQRPLAVDDTYTTNEDDALTTPAPGVLQNDSDPAGGTLTAEIVRQAAHGVVTLAADGSFTYTPRGDYHGLDSFIYRAFNGTAYSEQATVTLTVNPVNDPPVANDDAITVREGGNNRFSGPEQLDQSNTTRTYQFNAASLDIQQDVVPDKSGRLERVEVYIGQFTDPGRVLDFFVAEGGPWKSNLFAFRQQFTMTAEDFDGWYSIDVSEANIQLTPGERFTLGFRSTGSPDMFVLGSSVKNDGDLYPDGELWVNGAPYRPSGFGYDLAFRTYVVDGQPESVMANDTDRDSPPDSLHVETTPVVPPQHAASFVLNADGTFIYTHDGSETTSDSFVYRLVDASGASDLATVSITVAPVNDAPTAADDSATTDEDQAATIDLLANDNDMDGDSLTISHIGAPAHGAVTPGADGLVTYTPNANYYGEDSFTYTISDGNGAVATATVRVTVRPVNDDPTVTDAVFAIEENVADGAEVGRVQALDVDGDVLTYALRGADAAAFAIDALTGEISVADSSLLDFETQPQFDFFVDVSDRAGAQATANVHIDLIDVLEVAIDVAPDDPNNTVNLGAKEIEVAILGAVNFDPLAAIDLASLRLRALDSSPGAGVTSHRKHGLQYQQRDVNGDGVLDLVVRFKTSETGLQTGDTVVRLEGNLLREYGSEAFAIDQAINVVSGGDGKGGGKGNGKGNKSQ